MKVEKKVCEKNALHKNAEMKMRWWKVETFPDTRQWKLCYDPQLVFIINKSSIKMTEMLSHMASTKPWSDKVCCKTGSDKTIGQTKNSSLTQRLLQRKIFTCFLSRSLSFPIMLLLPVACFFPSVIANIPREMWYGKKLRTWSFISFSQKESFRQFEPVCRCQSLPTCLWKINKNLQQEKYTKKCARPGIRQFDYSSSF